MEKNQTAEQNDQLRLFLTQLKRCRGKLDRHTLLTLRGQALAGDLAGAQRGLSFLMRYGEKMRRIHAEDAR